MRREPSLHSAMPNSTGISTLPPELLRRIFLYNHPGLKIGTSRARVRKGLECSVAASQVCGQWREVAVRCKVLCHIRASNGLEYAWTVLGHFPSTSASANYTPQMQNTAKPSYLHWTNFRGCGCWISISSRTVASFHYLP